MLWEGLLCGQTVIAPVVEGGASVPTPPCVTGQVYFNTGAAAGQNLYVCANNTWTQTGYMQGTTAQAPPTCVTGQMYFATDATPGRNLYLCTTVNTWTRAGITRQAGFMLGQDSGPPLTDGITQGDIFTNQIGGGVHITKVWCSCDGGSPAIQLKNHGASSNLMTGQLTCFTAGASSTAFNSGEDAYSDGARLDLSLVTASTTKRVTVYYLYTVD
jgi:hypothetical protein